MKFNDKLEVLIWRMDMSKSDFAKEVGITYRALANYLAGIRIPKKSILQAISDYVGINEKDLVDEKFELELSREEDFLLNSGKTLREKNEAADYIRQSRGLFAGNSLSDDDKELLFACLEEIFYDAKDKATKYGRG